MASFTPFSHSHAQLQFTIYHIEKVKFWSNVVEVNFWKVIILNKSGIIYESFVIDLAQISQILKQDEGQ